MNVLNHPEVVTFLEHVPQGNSHDFRTWELLKQKMQRVVGWKAKSEELLSSDAYDEVYQAAWKIYAHTGRKGVL